MSSFHLAISRASGVVAVLPIARFIGHGGTDAKLNGFIEKRDDCGMASHEVGNAAMLRRAGVLRFAERVPAPALPPPIAGQAEFGRLAAGCWIDPKSREAARLQLPELAALADERSGVKHARRKIFVLALQSFEFDERLNFVKR